MTRFETIVYDYNDELAERLMEICGNHEFKVLGYSAYTINYDGTTSHVKFSALVSWDDGK